VKKARQDHFKMRTHQVHVKQRQKYLMALEAVRWNEGFRKETDAAFAKFWEREGESLWKVEIILTDAEGNKKSYKSLGELLGQQFEGPDSDPEVLYHYCFSPEARQVQQRYGLWYQYHYNQPALLSTPGQIEMVTFLNADEDASEINGKPVKIFQSPCLRAIRDEALHSLDIKINLSWPKEEIMNIFELLLDKALDEREHAGKKAFIRGMAVDPFPFKAWLMNKKQGKTPWEITQELFPFTKGRSYREVDKNYSPEARSHFKKVERAIIKADKLISSVTPIN
jgi:hypothetical protein